MSTAKAKRERAEKLEESARRLAAAAAHLPVIERAHGSAEDRAVREFYVALGSLQYWLTNAPGAL